MIKLYNLSIKFNNFAKITTINMYNLPINKKKNKKSRQFHDVKGGNKFHM